MKKIPLTSLFIFLYAIFLSAQESNQIVTIKIYSSSNKLTKGKSNQIAIEVKVQGPYHINAEKPSEPYLIPTTLDIETDEEITFGKKFFPKPQLKSFAFSDSPLAVYEGIFYIYTNLTIPPDFNKSKIELKTTLGIGGAFVLHSVQELAKVGLVDYDMDTSTVKLTNRLFPKKALEEKK